MSAARRRQTIRELWSDGDYPRVAELFAPAASSMLAGVHLVGRDVLDAGTGTGNVALAAARSGAVVSAFDLTPSLLDEARRRAHHLGLEITFREGDLLEVPWPDDRFDLVLSAFAAFLSDDPRQCLAELVRVGRPGGRIVTTAWSERSIFFQMTQTARRHDPELVALRDPGPFAHPGGLRELAQGLPVAEVTMDERPLPLDFPSAQAALDFFERTSGPVQRMMSAFGERWPEVRRDIVRDWSAMGSPTTNGVVLPASFQVATCHLSATRSTGEAATPMGPA